MDIVAIIALGMGAAWASGINLYAAIFVLGFLGASGDIVLPPDLAILSDPLVLAAAGFMYCVEFFTDKVPGVDTGWDALHTFVRIPAGAVLAAGAFGEISVPAQLAAGLIGGTLAAGTHATKAGSRVLINTSPEPVSNWVASIAEDVAVIGGLWVALHYPFLFLGLLAAMVIVMAWLLPRLWRGVKQVFGALRRWISPGRAPSSEPDDGGLVDPPLLTPRARLAAGPDPDPDAGGGSGPR